MSDPSHATRVAIVGAGHVGSTLAYTLLLKGIAADVVLIDEADTARAEGEALDLAHALAFAPPGRIWSGSLADAAGSAITVIAASVSRTPAQTADELAADNAAIVRRVAAQVGQLNPDGVILVVTNPVDVMTHVAIEASGLPAHQVIGSGTVLDTARLRQATAEHLHVDLRSVHLYVVGERGDAAVPVWSLANVGGMDLALACAGQGVPHDEGTRDRLFRAARDAGYRIAERKGAQSFAIAASLARIVEAVVRDEKATLSVSTRVTGAYALPGVPLSLPTLVGRGGAERVLYVTLAPEEFTALRESARSIEQAIAALAAAQRPAGPVV